MIIGGLTKASSTILVAEKLAQIRIRGFADETRLHEAEQKIAESTKLKRVERRKRRFRKRQDKF